MDIFIPFLLSQSVIDVSNAYNKISNVREIDKYLYLTLPKQLNKIITYKSLMHEDQTRNISFYLKNSIDKKLLKKETYKYFCNKNKFLKQRENYNSKGYKKDIYIKYDLNNLNYASYQVDVKKCFVNGLNDN